ncbi:putative cytosolic protein [Babesia caballi]|uniref:Hypothetical cytosolic protein n=1 Tax=Babesia caballi TaxID=5871 RepID=A0AAV4M0H5_BABCB|nr:hypothetical cytosolic protein [Babesia caballi]
MSFHGLELDDRVRHVVLEDVEHQRRQDHHEEQLQRAAVVQKGHQEVADGVHLPREHCEQHYADHFEAAHDAQPLDQIVHELVVSHVVRPLPRVGRQQHQLLPVPLGPRALHAPRRRVQHLELVVVGPHRVLCAQRVAADRLSA